MDRLALASVLAPVLLLVATGPSTTSALCTGKIGLKFPDSSRGRFAADSLGGATLAAERFSVTFLFPPLFGLSGLTTGALGKSPPVLFGTSEEEGSEEASDGLGSATEDIWMFYQ